MGTGKGIEKFNCASNGNGAEKLTVSIKQAEAHHYLIILTNVVNLISGWLNKRKIVFTKAYFHVHAQQMKNCTFYRFVYKSCVYMIAEFPQIASDLQKNHLNICIHIYNRHKKPKKGN